MVLFRPVGSDELRLIEKSGFSAFPPRLPEQPIFYPVLNEKYATEITEKWNKVFNADKKGYVVAFEIDDAFISKYQIQTVGASYHQEYWIPAEELEAFNQHIVGKIRVLKTFE